MAKWRKRYGRRMRWAKRQLIRQHGCLCGPCGRTIVLMHDATIDHIVPLSKGGTDDYANLQLAHDACNQAKRDMLPDEWSAFQEHFGA